MNRDDSKGHLFSSNSVDPPEFGSTVKQFIPENIYIYRKKEPQKNMVMIPHSKQYRRPCMTWIQTAMASSSRKGMTDL